MESFHAADADDDVPSPLPQLSSVAPKLVQLLSEMTSGLEEVRKTFNTFVSKIKSGEFSTEKGISYLETKYFLLLFYCQCIIYYILLKAKGKSVQNHPVIAQMIEIRMFLEKIRPIDKKLQYQIEKLLKLATTPSDTAKNDEFTGGADDDLMFKPNPDMLVSKIDQNEKEKDGIYRPPMIAPAAMDEERLSKDRKSEIRMRKEALRKASKSSLIKELANELEGRPEEIREFVGIESKEMTRELSRLQDRAQQEENLFARVPLSRVEKKKIKHLKKSRNGLMGMLDDFDDDVSHLINMEEEKQRGSRPQTDHTFSQPNERLRHPKKTTNFKKLKAKTSFKKRTNFKEKEYRR